MLALSVCVAPIQILTVPDGVMLEVGVVPDVNTFMKLEVALHPLLLVTMQR